MKRREMFRRALAVLTCVFPIARVFAAPTGVVDPLEVLIRELLREGAPHSGADKDVGFETATVPLLGAASTELMSQAIGRYQSIVNAGGWPSVPDGPTLRAGDHSARMAAIRQHLLISGDAPADRPTAPLLYGFADEDAVRRYQKRHGLVDDGILGEKTLRTMNVSAATRLMQLRHNLERMNYWRQRAVSRRYVVVNIPALELQAVANAEVALSSMAIIGRRSRPTPQLSANIIAVNFHPTWYVPTSIVRRDLFPKLLSDPGYFVREHYKLLRTEDGSEISPFEALHVNATPESIRIRQMPGPRNALGLIRLDMPNAYSVYLHDTASPHLFDGASRDVSSGCVRVRRIVDLTTWILGNEPSWTESTINEALREERSQTIRLQEPVAVHFVYLTAWGTPSRNPATSPTVQFRKDLYGLDGRVNAIGQK